MNSTSRHLRLEKKLVLATLDFAAAAAVAVVVFAVAAAVVVIAAAGVSAAAAVSVVAAAVVVVLHFSWKAILFQPFWQTHQSLRNFKSNFASKTSFFYSQRVAAAAAAAAFGKRLINERFSDCGGKRRSRESWSPSSASVFSLTRRWQTNPGEDGFGNNRDFSVRVLKAESENKFENLRLVAAAKVLDSVNLLVFWTKNFYKGSGGGSVGRAVASDTRGLRFISRDRQNLIYQMYNQNTEKTKRKRKRGRE